MTIKYKHYIQPLKHAVRSGKNAAKDIAQILRDEHVLRCVEDCNPELLSTSPEVEDHYDVDSALYKTFKRNISRKLDDIVEEYQEHDPACFCKAVSTGEHHFGRALFYWLDDESRNEALGYGAVSNKRIESRLLAFRFIDSYLHDFFPPPLLQELRCDIEESDIALKKYAGIEEKLKFLPAVVSQRDSATQKPTLDWSPVFHALIDEKVLSATYQSLHSSIIPERVTLSPQRIEYVNQSVKLLAYVHEISACWQFQISKLTEIELHPEMDFHQLDWSTYEQNYDFEFRAADWVIDKLRRIGFGNNVRIQSAGAGTAKIFGVMTLPNHFNHGGPDIFDCVNFLAGFGDALQVLKPLEIRQELHRRAKSMLSIYEDDSIENSTPILLKSAHQQTANEWMLDTYNTRYKSG